MIRAPRPRSSSSSSSAAAAGGAARAGGATSGPAAVLVVGPRENRRAEPGIKWECSLRRKSLGFLANLLGLRTRDDCLPAGMRLAPDEEQPTMMQQRSPRHEEPAALPGSAAHRRRRDEPEATPPSRIPSTLSVAAVDVVLACRQASPSHSILTLTPGRTRNIDQDMEALRLSRQDNPFLQVLASKESLIEPSEESESDDAILMSQEFGEADPLTLAQVHEHLVRSPPPASWSRAPTFHFPQRYAEEAGQRGPTAGQPERNGPRPRGSSVSPRSTLHQQQQHRSAAAPTTKMTTRSDGRYKSEGSVEIRDRHSHTFSLLNPAPIRSLSEARRMHRSADDSVQLMSSE